MEAELAIATGSFFTGCFLFLLSRFHFLSMFGFTLVLHFRNIRIILATGNVQHDTEFARLFGETCNRICIIINIKKPEDHMKCVIHQLFFFITLKNIYIFYRKRYRSVKCERVRNL